MSDNITDGDRTLLNAKYFLLTGEVLKSISEQVIFWEGYCFRSRDWWDFADAGRTFYLKQLFVATVIKSLFSFFKITFYLVLVWLMI